MSDETVEKPTYVWTLLLAMPGYLAPITINTDQGEPATEEELFRFLDLVAKDVGTERAYLRPAGAPICLRNQEFKKPSSLHVPDKRIIVPGRD